MIKCVISLRTKMGINKQSGVNTIKKREIIILLFLMGSVLLSAPFGTAQEQVQDFIYSADKKVIEHGEALFKQNCAVCHNFQQRGIGPNLAGVTSHASATWIANFIISSAKMIEGGDTRANRLFDEYQTPMPDFPELNKEEIQSILSFLHTQKDLANRNNKAINVGIPLSDPIPEKIQKSGLTLALQEVVTAPATANNSPFARINQMLVLSAKEDRAFINDMNGKLYELKESKLKLVLDISKAFPAFIPSPGLASGFGSYAFHPEFFENGLFYTTHTETLGVKPVDFGYADSIPVALQWVLSEWRIDNPTADIFSGSNREIFRVNMPTQVHGIQEIIFNPLATPKSEDYGLLYIGIGDGGAAEYGYPFLCEGNTYPWGSILRIDPRERSSKNKQYGVPRLNPFAMDNDPTTLGEIFSTGFRNPNRISWTPDGKMLIADIGLNQIEELNIGKAGANYGWPAREGTFLLNHRGHMDSVYMLPVDDHKYNYAYPVAQFDHDEGNAISAGFVYKGKISLLQDKYIFGDIVNGRIFFVENDQLKPGKPALIKELDLTFNGVNSTFREITGKRKADLRIGIGIDNQLYFYTKTDGKIWLVEDCF